MQKTFKKIFDKALKELPNRYHNFEKEDCVMYKGFKISRSNGLYNWQDTRYDDFYEVVDPLITSKILEQGFVKTLNEVMLHNDITKVRNLSKQIKKKDEKIAFWVKESTKIYTEYNSKKKTIQNNEKLSREERRKKLLNLSKKYEKVKNLYQKKRRVVHEEREELKTNKKFYESRLKLYNN